MLRSVFRPTITSQAQVRRYSLSVSLVATAAAVGIDVVNHLSFFSNWADCWRDWAVDAVAVPLIAYPISYAMGRTHFELYGAKREAERLSRTDPLTGLANRRAFYEAASRLGRAVLVLVIADIDRFKRINDQYGHVMGDEVIRAVSARMEAELDELGTVARLGGEEFALIGAARPASEIRARLQRFRIGVAEAPITAAGQTVQTTVSIGFAARADLDFDALYAAADRALYVAKAAGRDRVVDFDEIADLPNDAPAATALKQSA